MKKINFYPVLVISGVMLFTLGPGFSHAACLCPDRSVGAYKGMKAPLEVSSPGGNDKLMICGRPTVRESSTRMKIAEFDVVECNSGKFLVTYGALAECWVEAKNNGVSITRSIRIPQRPGDWAEFPYAKRTIQWTDHQWQTGQERLVFQAPKMSAEMIHSLLARFERVKKNGCSKGILANDAEFAGLLMVAALNGSQAARDAFPQLKTLCRLDGAIAETYHDFEHTLEDASKGLVSKSHDVWLGNERPGRN